MKESIIEIEYCRRRSADFCFGIEQLGIREQENIILVYPVKHAMWIKRHAE
jgi:hypothetical protein